MEGTAENGGSGNGKVVQGLRTGTLLTGGGGTMYGGEKLMEFGKGPTAGGALVGSVPMGPTGSEITEARSRRRTPPIGLRFDVAAFSRT